MAERGRKSVGCPICGRTTVQDLRPFCSRRCADVDLGRWLTEEYRIPAAPDDDGEEPGRSELDPS
ncbi:MAG: DNA gyrase inhibitor YacG [Acetobacteraceae bacterium]